MPASNNFFFIVLLFSSLSTGYSQNKGPANKDPEVIYHVFQRSFYDSNDDLHGDLNGLREKLGDLQELGVTSIQLLPLYQSDFYHNYFATDFKKIDPRFGTTKDLIDLIKEIHERGMKIYLDMETQYVTEDHLWYKDSYKNPSSPYTPYLVYNGPGNTQPESIVFNLTELNSYDGTVKKVTSVNLADKNVLEYNYDLFRYFMDPNLDGKFEDGVDGFRLDHMMDDLDWKGKFTGLFEKFWSPLLERLRKTNPKIKFVAEQSNWGSWGEEYFTKGNVDRVFAFRLQGAIASFDKQKLADVADSTFIMTPANDDQVVFIENHDMQRFSTAVRQDPGKLRVGAALNLFLGKLPAIYYGQELGMTGAGGFGKFGKTDGNDIPVREAYEWYTAIDGRGMALWYRNTGPWWDQTNLKAGDGVSLEEQKKDPNSLWNYYKNLLALRKSYAPLATGNYITITNANNSVFSFLRFENNNSLLVTVNLSGEKQTASVVMSQLRDKPKRAVPLLTKGKPILFSDKLDISLAPYGVEVWELK